MTDLPTDLAYGKVTGRFLTAIGDGPDVDTTPDASVPTGLLVKFTPKASTLRTTSPSVTVVPKPITCTVDADGYLTDPQGAAGVWLITGLYAVSYSGVSDFVLASHEIEVTTANTDVDPLDLTVATPPGVVLTPTQYTELNGRITVLEAGGGGTGGGGVTDHGALTGLGDDDHTQYLNNTRGDARYYTKTANDTLLEGKQPTGDYATNTALTSGLAGKAAAVHGHAIGDVTGLQAALDSKGTSSFTGAYTDLTGKPTLGTAASTDSTAYATAAQGAKADTALQPATAQAINAQTGTSYALVAGDAGKLITLTNTGAIGLTVPAATFTAGQRVDCIVLGAGMVTVSGSGGSTVNGTPSLVSRAQYSAFTVVALSASSFVVVGDLA